MACGTAVRKVYRRGLAHFGIALQNSPGNDLVAQLANLALDSLAYRLEYLAPPAPGQDLTVYVRPEDILLLL